MLRTAFAFALLPTVAFAGPDIQLQRSIAQGLKQFRIETDVAQLTVAQAAALHLEMSSPESEYIGTDFQTRQKILSILRWNEATHPDRK